MYPRRKRSTSRGVAHIVEIAMGSMNARTNGSSTSCAANRQGQCLGLFLCVSDWVYAEAQIEERSGAFHWSAKVLRHVHGTNQEEEREKKEERTKRAR
jgi:hypothetical protein